MGRAKRWEVALVVALSGAWVLACTDATDVNLLQVSATGVLFGQAYLDQNGNGAIDVGDAPLKNVSVELRSPGSQAVVVQTTTDSIGLYLLEDVPAGSYILQLDSAVLGDSLTVLGTGDSVTVALGDTTQVTLGVSYPTLTLDEVRAATPGRKVFTSGIVLNPRQPNGDGMVFFKGPTAYLRATDVDRASLAIGDSVRVLGRTAVDNGQPTLDAVTPFVLVSQAEFPVPVEVTAAVASAANGGALDAALVRIQDAEITDTSTLNDDFRFWAHNGGDSVEVVLRSFLSISPSPAVRPDTVVRVSQATGLLSPFDDGSGLRWRLLVRSASEITTAFKQADVGLTAGFDTAQATVGDTVEIIVTVQNAGPLTATGVQVTDTIPAALTFLSSTATSGGYDEATRIWSVGDLAVGATADTLRVRVEVTGGPGFVGNTARLRPLTHEVEINGGNNTATTNPPLTISSKQVDVGLTARFDTVQASVGDTVEIIVTAQNAGPRTATGVQVADTIPAALAFVSSTATSGSYDEATRIWSVGDLAAGAPADTLRMRVEVTGGPGSVGNTARLLPLTDEVDTNTANDTATANPQLTIS